MDQIKSRLSSKRTQNGIGLDGDFPMRGYLRIDLASNCNIRCIMCQAYNSMSVSEINFLDFDTFVSHTKGQLRKWTTIQLGNVSEATIHPRFNDFLRFVREESDATIHIVTNGKTLYRNASVINEVGNCLVQVSMDSINKDTHEYIREGSDYDKLISNLKLLDIQTRVFLSFTLMNSNIEEYDLMAQFCSEKGYSMSAFPMILREDRGSIIPFNLLKESLWFNQSALKSWLKKYYGEDYTGIINGSSAGVTNLWIDEFTCNAHENDLVITDKGFATLCYKSNVGNLNDQPLESIWTSNEAEEFRNQVNADRSPCFKCDYRQRCLSPSMSLMENHFSESIYSRLDKETVAALSASRNISDEKALKLFIDNIKNDCGIFDIHQEGRLFKADRVVGLSGVEPIYDNMGTLQAGSRHELHDLMIKSMQQTNHAECYGAPRLIAEPYLNRLKALLDRNFMNSKAYRTKIRPLLKAIYLWSIKKNQKPVWLRQRNPRLVIPQNFIAASLTENSESQKSSNQKAAPRFIENYKKYNVYLFATKFFAMPENEGEFDIEKMRTHLYSHWHIAATLEEIKREVYQSGKNSQLEKILVLCCAEPETVIAVADTLPSQDITLLIPKHQRGFYPNRLTVESIDVSGKPTDHFDLSNISPKLLNTLRERHYDLVVIPFKGRTNWKNIRIEQFAAELSNRILLKPDNGKGRLYKGDDLQRIFYNKAYLNNMFNWIPGLKGKKILDVGCSDGLVCDLLLTEEPFQVTGIDTLETVGCGYSDPRIAYRKMDATNLNFEDQEFDVCLSIATFEHIKDPLAALNEMKRVTKKGGYCYVQAAPLYHSPFGHHMFGYFDDQPWIHLRMAKDEILTYCKQKGIDEKIKSERGMETRDYIYSMINIDHVNGKLLEDYGLVQFMNSREIEVLNYSISYEGKDLLTPGLLKKLKHIPKNCLILHGFELIFKRIN